LHQLGDRLALPARLGRLQLTPADFRWAQWLWASSRSSPARGRAREPRYAEDGARPSNNLRTHLATLRTISVAPFIVGLHPQDYRGGRGPSWAPASGSRAGAPRFNRGAEGMKRRGTVSRRRTAVRGGLAILAALALLGAAVAVAKPITVTAGNLVLTFDSSITPKALSKKTFTPIT